MSELGGLVSWWAGVKHRGDKPDRKLFAKSFLLVWNTKVSYGAGNYMRMVSYRYCGTKVSCRTGNCMRKVSCSFGIQRCHVRQETVYKKVPAAVLKYRGVI